MPTLRITRNAVIASNIWAILEDCFSKQLRWLHSQNDSLVAPTFPATLVIPSNDQQAYFPNQGKALQAKTRGSSGWTYEPVLCRAVNRHWFAAHGIFYFGTAAWRASDETGPHVTRSTSRASIDLR